MNGVLAPFQDPELAFIPAGRASLFTGCNRVCMGSTVGVPSRVERARCITLQSAKLCARELFTTAEITVSTHPVATPPEPFGPRLEEARKKISVQRIRNGRTTRRTGWRKNGLSRDDRSCSRDEIAERKDLLYQRDADKSFTIKSRLLLNLLMLIKFG